MPHHGIATNGPAVQSGKRYAIGLGADAAHASTISVPDTGTDPILWGIFLVVPTSHTAIWVVFTFSARSERARTHFSDVDAYVLPRYKQAVAVSAALMFHHFRSLPVTKPWNPCMFVGWLACRCRASMSYSTQCHAKLMRSQHANTDSYACTDAKAATHFETCILQRALGGIPPGRYRAIVIRRSVMVALRITPNDGTLTIVATS